MSTPYSADPTLYLYTSLTAGSSHIITATSRLETILKANKIPFRALDVATDEKARMLWGRRSKGRKLPGLVKFGSVVGDLEEVEEWNEYGELKQQIGTVADVGGTPSTSTTPSKPTEATPSIPAPASSTEPASPSPDGRHISISDPKYNTEAATSDSKPAQSSKTVDSPLTMAMRQAGAEAAAKAGQKRSAKAIPATIPAASSTIDDSEADQKPDLSQLPTPTTDPELSASASDPAAATETTAGKTPAQLAAEGKKRTSVDKISENETTEDPNTNTASPPTSPSPTSESSASKDSSSPSLSNQEQVLSLHRNSSVTKEKSRLSTQVEPEDIPAAPESAESSPVSERKSPEGPTPAMGQVRTHRGSSISLATKAEIAEVERRNTITEESGEEEEEAVEEEEEEEEKGPESVNRSTGDQVADAAESEAGEAAEKPQEQDAKDPEKAGVSVGD